MCCGNNDTSCFDQSCACVCNGCDHVRLRNQIREAAARQQMLAITLNETPGCFEVLTVRNDRHQPFEAFDVKLNFTRGVTLRRWGGWESMTAALAAVPRLRKGESLL